jgi:hypothetical protein
MLQIFEIALSSTQKKEMARQSRVDEILSGAVKIMF